MAPACGGDVARPFRVDRVGKRGLQLGAIHGVVRGAVEDDVRLAVRNQRLNRFPVDNRKPVMRDCGFGSKQLDELETELSAGAENERSQSEAWSACGARPD